MINKFRKVIVLFALTGIVWLAGHLGGAENLLTFMPEDDPSLDVFHYSAQVTMILGFSLLAAYLFGRLVAPTGLPKITGYLVAGAILGPYCLKFITPQIRNELYVINEIALGLIALTAGGELSISRLRKRFKSILYITGFHTFLIFALTTGAVFCAAAICGWAGIELPFAKDVTTPQLVAIALLLGLVASAKSPASTVAIINETRSRGPMTDIALGVTVLKDVVIILLMAVTLTLCSSLVDPDKTFRMSVLWETGYGIIVSFGLGIIFGSLISAYLKYVNKENALFLLGMVFLAVELEILMNRDWHIDAHFLLICMIAGFVVENFSSRGGELIHGLEKGSLPVYVVFFLLGGAGLNFELLAAMWPFALGFVVLRGVLIYGTTWSGATIAGERKIIRSHAWMAFLTQAGITLGLAEMIRKQYPEIGQGLYTLILSMVALNQLIGPALFKYALSKAGEIGAARVDSNEPKPLPVAKPGL